MVSPSTPPKNSRSTQHWLRQIFPAQPYARASDKALGGLGALVAMFGLLWGSSHFAPQLVVFVVASMGASAVLFFAAPHSPLAQPWPFVGGHLLSAVIGVTSYKLVPDTVAAAALAVALAIMAMHFLHCLHPPGGATALLAVVGGAAVNQLGYGYVVTPVGLNVLLFLVLALLVNNLIPGRHYPLRVAEPSAGPDLAGWPLGKFGVGRGDFEAALKEIGEFIDIAEDDLEQIYAAATLHAHRRRMGEIRVRDIMQRETGGAQFGDALEDVWELMRRDKTKGVAVLDRARRVIGIVTIVDFLKRADATGPTNVIERLTAFVRRTPGVTSDKPEVVGQIMTAKAITVQQDAHIVSLIPLFSRHDIHHIPVVDDEQRLVGMVTQSDLMAALYSYRTALTELAPRSAPRSDA